MTRDLAHARSTDRSVCATSLRAFFVAVLLFVYAGLPLVAGLQRTDRMACCRDDGAHRCFLRDRASAAGGTKLTTSDRCSVRSSKAVSIGAAILSASLPGSLVRAAVSLDSIETLRGFLSIDSSRPSRAPPVS
jgi:hypothetical protein